MDNSITHLSQPRSGPKVGDACVPDGARDRAEHRQGLAVAAAAVALTAYGGAIALIVGVISLGAELDGRLPFDSPIFGGVALAVVVGVPFTLVAVAAWRGVDRTQQLSLTAGCMLVGWIVVEYLFIRELSFFHPLYLAIGVGFVRGKQVAGADASWSPVSRRLRRLGLAGSSCLAAVAALQWLGRTAGSTRPERRASLPGDQIVRRPMVVTTHAITIDAEPRHVWPWLVQMGWHRGGWYTDRWVDLLLFPDNQASADRVIPQLQNLEVGDRVPDGAPDRNCDFVVADIDPLHHLVLHSNEHLPPRWAERYGAWIDWSWAFVLHDHGDGRTRLVVRSRLRLGPPWVAMTYSLGVVPADFVMSNQMLRGVRRRAEALAASQSIRRCSHNRTGSEWAS